MISLWCVHQYRTPVRILQEQLPVVGRLGLVPADIDLEGDGGRDRVRACHAPTPTEDVQLSVGNLGRIAQHHGYLHKSRGYRFLSGAR